MTIQTCYYANRRHCKLTAMLQKDRKAVLALEIVTTLEGHKKCIRHSHKNHLEQKPFAPLLSSFFDKIDAYAVQNQFY